MIVRGHPTTLILAPIESAYMLVLGNILQRFTHIGAFLRRKTAFTLHPIPRQRFWGWCWGPQREEGRR